MGSDEGRRTRAIRTLLVAGAILVVVSASALFVLHRPQVDPAGADRAPDLTVAVEYDAAVDQVAVIHDGGDPVPAGEVVVRSDDRERSWAEVAGVSASRNVTAGDRVWVDADGLDHLEVYWVSDDAAGDVRLATWTREG